MENQTPSHGEQFAGLRSDAQAGRENCAWIPAAIHAAIAAIFARIFGRLEQLLALWQAGAMPPPPARTPVRRHPAARTSRRRAHRPRRATHTKNPITRASHARPCPSRAPSIRPRIASSRARPGRDPPRVARANTPQPRSPAHALIVTI